MEQAAKRKMLVSLTTNGSSSPALYRRLVESGMTEVRISIDSHDAAEFDKIVGVNGAFRRVENTIRELVRLRDEEQRSIFIILNVSTEFFDLERCKHIIDYLLAAAPDDMKLLVIAESASSIQSKASRKAVDEILDLVRQRNPDGYELLEKKVRTLFRKNTFGLKGMDARYLMKRCYIPLTERTIDAKGIYPCSIYLDIPGTRLHRQSLPLKNSRRP